MEPARTNKSQFITIGVAAILASVTFAGCGGNAGGGLLGPVDETPQAGSVVAEANQDLITIRKLYQENENKREDIKKAMAANDTVTAKKLADEVVDLINQGSASARDAIEKIQRAEAMNINDDYRTYLLLKRRSLELEIEAFENYRQAARILRDNFDPKDAAKRERVKAEFATRSDRYREKMEDARDTSSQANEVAKDALRKQQKGQ